MFFHNKGRNCQLARKTINLCGASSIMHLFVFFNITLQIAMVKLAQQNEGLIVPGYTHLQRAQPVLLQHLLLAYVEQVSRIWLTSWSIFTYLSVGAFWLY